MGALGLLAWRVSRIQITNELGGTSNMISQDVLYMIYGILLLIYIAHVIKLFTLIFPVEKRLPEEEKYPFSSVAALNTTYIANFGAELAVVSMLPAFFEGIYSIGHESAGLIASSFAFINLVARPLGGLISDTMKNRKLVMSIYMLGIALGFLGMGFINSSWPIWIAVAITIICSMFVQGAEGATFAIIPLIKRKMTGQIAGMAGAFGNVGAVIYLVIYSWSIQVHSFTSSQEELHLVFSTA